MTGNLSFNPPLGLGFSEDDIHLPITLLCDFLSQLALEQMAPYDTENSKKIMIIIIHHYFFAILGIIGYHLIIII